MQNIIIVELGHKNEFIYFYLSETIVAAEEEELWQELVMAEVGGLLDRNGKLVPSLSLYRFVDLMKILEILNVDLDMLDMETMNVALESLV